jgi:uncharacterized phage protein gp47/JayE
VVDLTTPTRDQIIATYERDYALRCPSAMTGPGTQPRLEAVQIADQLLPVYANTIKAARALDDEQKTLEELLSEADRIGVSIPGASGSSGTVTIRAAVAGTVIFAGDILTETVSRQYFYCTTTGLYLDGGTVSIAASSTGPATNLDAATVLQWSVPRPGCATTCTVDATTGGAGLTGGADAPGREQVLEALREARANPPGSGNDSDYRAWMRATPGVQLEEAFVYPCAWGPGTVGWNFTVSPDKYGTRTPTATQIALVRAQLELSPRTDLKFHLATVGETVDVVCKASWAFAATQWADETPWPAYYPEAPVAGSGAIVIFSGASPLSCVIESFNADYTTCGDPVAGQTLALYDAPNKVFRNKRILTVAGGGPWTVTFDGTLSASDTTYTPVAGQRVMPWSYSLDAIPPIVTAHFAGIGPGETHSATYLDGQRTKRDPAVGESWADRVTKTLETSLESLAQVEFLDIEEGGDTVATAAMTPHILTLGDLSVFPR